MWPILRYWQNICLEGLGKTIENLSQNSRSPERNQNPGPPEYVARRCIRYKSKREERDEWVHMMVKHKFRLFFADYAIRECSVFA
jgi:hypothetical protein